MMMDSSTEQLHHHQELAMGSQTLESMLGCGPKSGQEKKARPADMQAQKCPRCDSSNTKFCYYNNYSLSQPRYFCKSCRRYWTKGGTLRNVPVGGGCRRNKRSSSSSSSSSSSKRSQDHHHPMLPVPVPSSYDSSDLGLAIARLHQKPGDGTGSGQLLGSDDNNDNFSIWGNYNYPNMPRHHDDRHYLGSLGLGAFLESHPPMSGGMQNLYYGLGLGNGNHLEIGSEAQDTGIPFEEFGGGGPTTGPVKQEESRVLWGFPWQSSIGGGGDGNAADSWNAIGSIGSSSNWHGLLNSPLM